VSARILIIEDNPTNMELMVYLLTAFGYTPLMAIDGVSGVEARARRKPDLIICDVHLPKLDGYGVVAALKAGPRAAPHPGAGGDRAGDGGRPRAPAGGRLRRLHRQADRAGHLRHRTRKLFARRTALKPPAPGCRGGRGAAKPRSRHHPDRRRPCAEPRISDDAARLRRPPAGGSGQRRRGLKMVRAEAARPGHLRHPDAEHGRLRFVTAAAQRPRHRRPAGHLLHRHLPRARGQPMAEACGVRWVLPKPSDPDVILRTVHEALGMAEPERCRRIWQRGVGRQAHVRDRPYGGRVPRRSRVEQPGDLAHGAGRRRARSDKPERR
jgi:CheY-like chemotaxis protein